VHVGVHQTDSRVDITGDVTPSSDVEPTVPLTVVVEAALHPSRTELAKTRNHSPLEVVATSRSSPTTPRSAVDCSKQTMTSSTAPAIGDGKCFAAGRRQQTQYAKMTSGHCRTDDVNGTAAGLVVLLLTVQICKAVAGFSCWPMSFYLRTVSPCTHVARLCCTD
jgi:hypothetical protein